MVEFFVGLVVSAVLTLLVVRSARHHGHLSGDWDNSGPQKFHTGSVPRVGGVGIVGGLVAWVVAAWFHARAVAELGVLVLVAGAPALLTGIAEDLTKRISPRQRLVATACSAAIGIWLLHASITRTDIPGLDWLVGFTVGSWLATTFAVVGVANAFNIIDGFNGLSSMCVALILASVAYVSFQVGDESLLALAVAGIGAVLGFFIWNFPSGLIFLGDGGAYFLGFYVAQLEILLIHRHPEVSPLFPLVTCIYPVFETIFSIYRRKVLRGRSPTMPDGIHFHTLIYRRLVRWASGPQEARALARRNSMTSPYLWAMCMISLIPATLFWRQTSALVITMAAFALVYVYLYWRIVRFRSPRWLVIRPGMRAGAHRG